MLLKETSIGAGRVCKDFGGGHHLGHGGPGQTETEEEERLCSLLELAHPYHLPLEHQSAGSRVFGLRAHKRLDLGWESHPWLSWVSSLWPWNWVMPPAVLVLRLADCVSWTLSGSVTAWANSPNTCPFMHPYIYLSTYLSPFQINNINKDATKIHVFMWSVFWQSIFHHLVHLFLSNAFCFLNKPFSSDKNCLLHQGAQSERMRHALWPILLLNKNSVDCSFVFPSTSLSLFVLRTISLFSTIHHASIWLDPHQPHATEF